jgi:hypothetical protein
MLSLGYFGCRAQYTQYHIVKNHDNCPGGVDSKLIAYDTNLFISIIIKFAPYLHYSSTFFTVKAENFLIGKLRSVHA